MLPWHYYQTMGFNIFLLFVFRWIGNTISNQSIERRNEARALAADALDQPTPLLQSKVASARSQGERKVIAKSDIVYSTAEGEASKGATAREVEDWERRLGEGASGKKGW